MSLSKARRELNLALLIGSLVFVVTAAPALYFWREYQVNRTSGIFLDRATALEQSDDFGKAASYLHRFLRLRPESPHVRVRLAETFDQSATDPRAKQRAVELYAQALGAVEADKSEPQPQLQLAQAVPRLRQRRGQLQLELGRYAEAEAEARELLRVDKDNPDGWRLLALALYGRFQIGALRHPDKLAISVGATFEEALADDRGDVELAQIFARICRGHVKLLSEQQQRWSQDRRDISADAVMDQMVAAEPENAHTYLARFHYRERYELLGSQDDLKKALEYDRDDRFVVIAAARYWRERAEDLTGEANRFIPDDLLGAGPPDDTAPDFGASTTVSTVAERASEVGPREAAASLYYGRAQQYYQQLVDELHVSVEEVHVGLGDVLNVQGKVAEAIEIWRVGLIDVVGGNFLLQTRLADALINQGELAEADKVLESLKTAVRNSAYRLAPTQRLALQQTVDLVQAKRHVLAGQCLKAIPLLRRLTGQTSESDRSQQSYVWWLLGYAYSTVAQWDQAASAYQEATTIQPNVVTLQLLAADSWMRSGKPDTAIRHYQQALDTHAAPDLWLALARAQLQSQLRQPAREREWTAFQNSLAHATEKPTSDEAPSLSDPWRATLLNVQFTIAKAGEQSNRDVIVAAATALLHREEELHPTAVGLFRRLPMIYERLDSQEEANDALRRFGELVPDQAEFLLAKARLLIGREQFQQARVLLREGLDALPESSHHSIRTALVQIDLEEANFEDAKDGLSRLRDQYPDSIVLVRRLAELAFRQGDFEGVEGWENTLRQLEGPTGSYWRHFRALRLIGQAQTVQDAAFREAVDLTAELQQQRPSWPAPHVLQGLIRQRQGKIEQAIESYEEALRLGENRLNVYERLIELLNITERFAEASKYLGMLQHSDSLTLDTLQISVAASQGQFERALRIARQGVDRRPTDLMAHLWLGQMLIASDKLDEAESVFQHTVEIAPDDERSWNGLFGFYVRADQKEQARQTLERLAKLSKLSAYQRVFVLAQGHEILGNDLEAERYYLEAERLAPDRIAVMTRLAAFYLRRNMVKAITVLEWLVEAAPESNAARRTLAALLASRGEENDFERARQLLGQIGDDGIVATLDLRLQAVLLARRGGAEHKQNLKEALTIMENIVANSPNPADGDRQLLAQLLVIESHLSDDSDEQQALLRSAREQHVALVARNKPKASHLVRFIEFLLQTKQDEEAVGWLAKLESALVGANPPDSEKLVLYIKYVVDRNFLSQAGAALGRLESLLAQDPDPASETIEKYLDLQLRHCADTGALDAVTVGNLDRWLDRLASLDNDSIQTLILRARLLKAQGHTDRIETLAEAFARQKMSKMPDDEQQYELIVGLARLYAAVEMHPQAERWCRELVKRRPDRFDRLAAALVAQDRMQEAINVFRNASKHDASARPAIILAAALLTGSPTTEDFEMAEPILAKAMREHPQDISLLMGVANVRVLQGQTGEAARLYQRVLETRPKDATALNNLAAVLAEVPGKETEALSYIDQAIQMAGPKAALLDTKGLIFLQYGHASEAIRPLDLAVASSRPNPLYHFHLAVALARADNTDEAVDNTDEAKKHFRQALNGHIERQLLTPSDKKFLEDLKAQFKE